MYIVIQDLLYIYHEKILKHLKSDLFAEDTWDVRNFNVAVYIINGNIINGLQYPREGAKSKMITSQEPRNRFNIF